MVSKIGTSHRYEPEPDGLRAITALVVLREKVIRPLLAASQRPESQAKPNHPMPVEHHYEHLRVGMRDLSGVNYFFRSATITFPFGAWQQ
jgi:hypothetical protein